MCIALCAYSWINTRAVSWVSVAHIQVAVHMYINCMMLFLWALSWSVHHTTPPGLLSPPSEKSFVLLLASKINWGKSAVLAGSQQPWLGNPVMSKVVPAGRQCTLTPVMCDSEGKNGFTVIYSGEKWCRMLMFSSICLLAAGKTLGFLVLFLSFPIFSPKVQQNSNIHNWSNTQKFSMKLITFVFFWDFFFKLQTSQKTDSLPYICTYFSALLLMCVHTVC